MTEREEALRLAKEAGFELHDGYANWMWKGNDAAIEKLIRLARAQPDVVRDALRLDWLDAQWGHGVHVEVCAANDGRAADSLGRFATVFTREGRTHRGSNVREAIDAALSAPKPGGNLTWPICPTCGKPCETFSTTGCIGGQQHMPSRSFVMRGNKTYHLGCEPKS